MSLSTRKTELFRSHPDSDGALVWEGAFLVAVLLQLSHIHDGDEGKWFIDWGSSPEFKTDDIFASLDAAEDWLATRVAGAG